MMTQTHTLMACALFARPEKSRLQNTALVLGSLAPDAAIYTLFAWSKLAGIPERQLWNEIYFSEPMLTFTAIGNSFPLYFAILLLGIALAKRTDAAGPVNYGAIATQSALGLFALGAMVHLAGDFPVHVDDAHPHFWPLTDWRFVSPVSYWDSDHQGDKFALVEALLGVILSVILFRRFKALWVRVLTALVILAYIGVPLYFTLVLG